MSTSTGPSETHEQTSISAYLIEGQALYYQHFSSPPRNASDPAIDEFDRVIEEFVESKCYAGYSNAFVQSRAYFEREGDGRLGRHAITTG
jgi:hypothetical protein